MFDTPKISLVSADNKNSHISCRLLVIFSFHLEITSADVCICAVVNQCLDRCQCSDERLHHRAWHEGLCSSACGCHGNTDRAVCDLPTFPNTHPFNLGVLTVVMSACQSGLGSFSKSANLLLQLKDFDLLIVSDQNHTCSLSNSRRTLESVAMCVCVCGHECVCSAFVFKPLVYP